MSRFPKLNTRFDSLHPLHIFRLGYLAMSTLNDVRPVGSAVFSQAHGVRIHGMTVQSGRLDQRPTFAELFTPKTITSCARAYSAAALRADVLSGPPSHRCPAAVDGDRHRFRRSPPARAYHGDRRRFIISALGAAASRSAVRLLPHGLVAASIHNRGVRRHVAIDDDGRRLPDGDGSLRLGTTSSSSRIQ